MSNYPDWVNAHKEKGTTIKKVGNSYYLYKSTSKRVPGKKHPQPIQKFIGKITEQGVERSETKKIALGNVRVYEYGLSYVLKKLVFMKFSKDIKDKEKANQIFLNIINHFSKSSYLLRGVNLLSTKELHINLNLQIQKSERLCGFKIDELLPLKELYLVVVDGHEMISAETEEIKNIMKRIGVADYEIQR